MSGSQHSVDGIEVHVEGEGSHTIVMIHGWPDTHRLWDGTVEGLKSTYRCVRFTLPGFDITQSPRPTSLAQMTALFSRIVSTVSPDKPVVLLLHDWGCLFGYEFAARYPEQVSRVVGVDIGDHNSGAYLRSLPAKAKWQIFFYQFWLALAWKLGRFSPSLGDGMTRWMAHAMRCRTAPASMGWQMNYPYAMQWFGLLDGFHGAARVNPHCPMLYIYGLRKPFMFQSAQWLEHISSRPGSVVQAFPTGHWVMAHQPAEFLDCVKNWLTKTREPENIR